MQKYVEICIVYAKNMHKYAKNMYFISKICKESARNLQEYAQICTNMYKYVEICIIYAKNAENMHKYARNM